MKDVQTGSRKTGDMGISEKWKEHTGHRSLGSHLTEAKCAIDFRNLESESLCTNAQCLTHSCVTAA
jgi:hypothetical protein